MGKPTEAKPELRRCPRCNFKLKSNNQNKHGLCGYCQTELGHNGRLTKWIADGKPREKAYRKHQRTSKPSAKRIVGLSDYTVNELLGELEARKEEAQRLLKLLG